METSYAAPAAASRVDPYQRSVQIYTFRSFPGERGKEMYFYLCWVCHNEYTTRENYVPNAPVLEGLFKRTLLRTGDPVTEATVSATIRRGRPAMPAFGAMLDEAQIAELVAFLKSDACCWNEGNPPRNPAYRADR